MILRGSFIRSHLIEFSEAALTRSGFALSILRKLGYIATAMSDKMIQDDCEELWVVHAEDKSWSLPVSVIPVTMDGNTLYAVSDMIGFDMPQWTAINNRLSPAATGKSGTFWIVPRVGMSAVAERVRGIHAKWYVRWNNTSPTKPQQSFGVEEKIEPPEPTAATRKFIDHIVWKARALSKEDVLFIWQCIVEELPNWLVEKRQPISFGYFTLWALPFRTNWKQILLSKYPNIASTMRLGRDERNAKLAMTTFERDIQHTDLVEFHTKTRSVGWTLECVPTKHWDELIQDRESKRRKHLGPAEYARIWSRMIWGVQNVIYDIFGSFVAKTCIPCAEPVRSGNTGSLSLGPCCPGGRAGPQSRDLVEVSPVYYDNSRPVVTFGEPGSLAETVPVLPKKVQPIRFASDDVRDTGRDLRIGGGSET